MISGTEAIKVIEKHQGDAIVVTTMTPLSLWDPLTSRQKFHLPVVNSMGKASSIGLGIALARPDKKVLVIDGDGSLLMNLGALVTIANMSPSNLIHFVYQNGTYGVSGGQPIPGISGFRFVDFALGAGYPNAFHLDDLEEFHIQLPQILDMGGPILVCLEVDDEGYQPKVPTRATKHAFNEVKEALALEKGRTNNKNEANN